MENLHFLRYTHTHTHGEYKKCHAKYYLFTANIKNSQKKLIPKHARNMQFLRVCRYNVMEIIRSFTLLFLLSSENAKRTEYN